MRYTLTWSCSICHLSQHTILQTGEPWPVYCTKCLPKDKTNV